MTTGLEALQTGLKALGYDALFNADAECGCDGDCPCEESPLDCECGYLHKYAQPGYDEWCATVPCTGDDCVICGRWKPEGEGDE